MADAVEAVQLGSEPGEVQEQTQEETPVVEAPSAAEEPQETPDEVKFEDLPESWQKEIRDLRREAASKRAAAREATSETDSQLERIAALEARLEEAEEEKAAAAASAEKTQILAERNLPTKCLPNLHGENAEEWAASADFLVELRGTRASGPDPVQAAVSNQSDTKSSRERLADDFFAGLK